MIDIARRQSVECLVNGSSLASAGMFMRSGSAILIPWWKQTLSFGAELAGPLIWSASKQAGDRLPFSAAVSSKAAQERCPCPES